MRDAVAGQRNRSVCPSHPWPSPSRASRRLSAMSGQRTTGRSDARTGWSPSYALRRPGFMRLRRSGPARPYSGVFCGQARPPSTCAAQGAPNGGSGGGGGGGGGGEGGGGPRPSPGPSRPSPSCPCMSVCDCFHRAVRAVRGSRRSPRVIPLRLEHRLRGFSEAPRPTTHDVRAAHAGFPSPPSPRTGLRRSRSRLRRECVRGSLSGRRECTRDLVEVEQASRSSRTFTVRAVPRAPMWPEHLRVLAAPACSAPDGRRRAGAHVGGCREASMIATGRARSAGRTGFSSASSRTAGRARRRLR
jgi:hypothetical protein